MEIASFSPVSPPSLSPELVNLYQSLSIDQQRLFIKVFRYLWGVVLPAQSFRGRSGPLRSYWALDIVLRSYSLSPALLSLLTFIYYMTQEGRKYICTADVYSNNSILPYCNAGSKQDYISMLKRRGYLSRSYSNPDQPYLKRSFRRQPVFIKLSPAGVHVITGIEKDLYKLLLNTSLNDLTGKNKRP